MINAFRLTPAGLGLCLLAGCANSFVVPVIGRIGESAAQGEAVTRTDGNGTFWIETVDGLRCDGAYDLLVTSPTIRMPVKCNDGRTGLLIGTKQGGSDTVIGKLNDGTEILVRRDMLKSTVWRQDLQN